MKVRLGMMGMVLALSVTAAHAQVTSEGQSNESAAKEYFDGTRVFIKAGPGMSSLSTSDSSLSGTRSGISIAAEADLPLSGRFSLLTGLDYVQKGMTMGIEGLASATIALNYLEIPIQAKANFQWGPASQFSLAAGPYVAFAISKSTSADFLGESVSPDSGTSVSSISSLDYGARVGANYEYSFQKSLSFVAGLNYDIGLKNIDTSGSSVHTRSMIGNVGLGMHI